MDAVLGVSLTPSTVGLVLVEGQEADGATVDHETFDIRDLEPLALADVTERVVAAVARAEAVAADRGHRLQSIGVTWSDGADIEASQLLTALSEAGFANVLPIRFPQATDTLARGIAGVVGFDTTAVCVIEPELVLALTASPGDGPVRTAQIHGIETVQELTDWLRRQFAAGRPRPDALVVVGSAVDFDALMRKLQAALAVPVFTPADQGVALARGAALASARRGRFMFTEPAPGLTRGHWSPAQLAPAVMLAVGVITFVVSLSLAISQHMVGPEPESRQTRPVVNVSGTPAATNQKPPVVIPPAPVPVPQAPALAEPPAVVEQPVAPEFISEPVPDAAPVEAPAPVVPAAPPPQALPAPPVLAPPVPTKKPLLSRIRDRLRGGPDEPEQQPFGGPVPPAPELVPPGVAPPPAPEAPPPVAPEPPPPPAEIVPPPVPPPDIVPPPPPAP